MRFPGKAQVLLRPENNAFLHCDPGSAGGVGGDRFILVAETDAEQDFRAIGDLESFPDQVGVIAHGTHGATVQAKGNHGEHQGLGVHAHIHGNGGAEFRIHADEGDMGGVEEFEIAQGGALAAFPVVATNAHLRIQRHGALHLAAAVFIAKIAAVFVIGIGRHPIGGAFQHLPAQAVLEFARGHIHLPGLHIAVRRRLPGNLENALEDIRRHFPVEKAPHRAPAGDGFVQAHRRGGGIGAARCRGSAVEFLDHLVHGWPGFGFG